MTSTPQYHGIHQFKSTPVYWEKEFAGTKPNTVRRIPDDDSRSQIQVGDIIVIVNTETGQKLAREVTDVSKWEDLTIISWRHRE